MRERDERKSWTIKKNDDRAKKRIKKRRNEKV